MSPLGTLRIWALDKKLRMFSDHYEHEVRTLLHANFFAPFRGGTEADRKSDTGLGGLERAAAERCNPGGCCGDIERIGPYHGFGRFPGDDQRSRRYEHGAECERSNNDLTACMHLDQFCYWGVRLVGIPNRANRDPAGHALGRSNCFQSTAGTRFTFTGPGGREQRSNLLDQSHW